MVGYPSLTSYNRTDGLNTLTFDNQIDSIWTYSIGTQTEGTQIYMIQINMELVPPTRSKLAMRRRA